MFWVTELKLSAGSQAARGPRLLELCRKCWVVSNGSRPLEGKHQLASHVGGERDRVVFVAEVGEEVVEVSVA
jgi:hypothetical protein